MAIHIGVGVPQAKPTKLVNPAANVIFAAHKYIAAITNLN